MVQACYPDRKKSNIATSAKSKLAQAQRVIRRVNKREPNAKGQVKFSRTGEIKVAALSKDGPNNPILGWHG
jgi:hypothetical protein